MLYTMFIHVFIKAYEGARMSCADLEGVVEKEPPEKINFIKFT